MRFLIKPVLAICVALEVSLVVLSALRIDYPKLLAVIPLLVIFSFVSFLLIYVLVSASRVGWIEAAGEIASRFHIPYKPLAVWISEIAMLAAFLPRGSNSKYSDIDFSYHSSLRPVVWCISVLSVVEISVVHLAISIDWIRWSVFALSLYGVVALFGFYRSLLINPHRLDNSIVSIRYGNRLVAVFPVEDMKTYGRCSPGDGGSITFSGGVARVPVFSQVNTYVEMLEPVTVKDIFVGRRTVTKFEFFVDDRDSFLASLADS